LFLNADTVTGCLISSLVIELWQWCLLMHALELHRMSTESAGPDCDICNFCSKNYTVNAWTKKVVSQFAFTAMPRCTLSERPFYAKWCLEIEVGQQCVTDEKWIDVTSDEFLVLKLLRT